MANITPSSFAGHSLLCHYQCHGECDATFGASKTAIGKLLEIEQDIHRAGFGIFLQETAQLLVVEG